jgi:glycosyltransferase involved in cell wall biosynthesis
MAIIGLDATYLTSYGKGVSRHQYNLIKSLAKLDKKNCYYVFLNNKNMLPDLPKQNNFHYIKVYIPKRIIWDQFQVPWLSRKYKLDIYHCLLDTLPVMGKVKCVLCVVEIPDYRIELAGKISHNSLYASISHKYIMLSFGPSLKKARLIITSSQSTKVDLMQRYNVNEKKIRVLYHAADEQFCTLLDREVLLDTRKKYNAEKGYILHISSLDPRDNTPVVIRAYQKARSAAGITQKLIICGNVDSKRMGLEELITEFNLKDSVIFTGRLPDNELVALYQAADLFIDPSLYEGFGLQVVEAMSCGIPVITSNVTSLPEIVGDAGILLDPADIGGFASALVSVLTDAGMQNAMRQKSLARAKFFSWDKAARDTLAIYDELFFELGD